MNEVWDLNPIYEGFSDPAYERDFLALQADVEAFEAFVQTLSQLEPRQGLKRGLELQEDIVRLVSELILYASLRQSVDTTDMEANSQFGRVLGLYSGIAAPAAAFKAWAAKLPNLSQLIDGDALLEQYRFLLEDMAASSRYLLPGIGESVAARYQLSGSNAWAEMHQYLTSTVPVSYRGKVTTLSEIRSMAHDPDPQVRRDAFRAEQECYKAIEIPAAYAMNSIKLETISDCRLRGYASPLARTLEESHVKRETLDAMLGAINEYLPKFWQYLRAKAKALGHENGLPWYDLYAPMGTPSPRITTEYTRDYLVELFASFDSQLSQMVADAFDHGWIDFYPHSGKTDGAFCSGSMKLGESRILTNFTGSFSDVVILAHELGHAFHNLCLNDQRPLNRDYSMCVAETASTFNECIVMNKAIRDAATTGEKLALLENQLRDVTQIIVDIYSRYLFETAVFERREQEFLNPETLCNMMLEAQKQAYGTGMDAQTLHPYMWICKSHYYGAIFYNFPYAFGGLFARGLYARYEQEGEAFIPKYKQLLRTTPIATAEDTAKVAGIDLTDIDFWRSALQIVANKIDLFCRLAEEQ